jgi:hypothetical protein
VKLDGIDLLPTWRGEARPRERSLYWEWPIREGGRWLAVRSGDWKLIEGPDGTELYDLAQDAGEARNVAAEHADRVRALTKRLKAWLATEMAAPERK